MAVSAGIRTSWRLRRRRRRREALGRRRQRCRPRPLPRCHPFLPPLQMEEEGPTCAGLLGGGFRPLGVEMEAAPWQTRTMTTQRGTSCLPCRNSLTTTIKLLHRRPAAGAGTRIRSRFTLTRRRKISHMVLRSLPPLRITTTLILISTTTTTERTPVRSVRCCSPLRGRLRPPPREGTRPLVRTRTRIRSSPLLTTCLEPSPFLPSLRELPPPSRCPIMHDDNLPRGSSRPRVGSLEGWGWGWGRESRRRRVDRTRIGRR